MERLHERGSNRLLGVFSFSFGAVLLATTSVLLGLFIFAIPLGLELFFFENLSAEYSSTSSISVRFFQAGVEVNLGIAFTSLLLIYALCFVLAWKQKSIFRSLDAFFPKPIALCLRRSLTVLPLISSLTYIVVKHIHSFEISYGIPIGEPPLPKDTLLSFFELSVSPLAEEMVYRVLPIGIFMIARLLASTKKPESAVTWRQQLKFILLVLASPKDAKRKLSLKTVDDSGFRQGITRDEWAMILFTSAFFGLSHYLSTSTWEVGKIASTFVQGLVWGLSYMVYGIQAPILMHWYFNYYFYAYGLAAAVHPNLAVLSLLNERFTLVSAFFGSVLVIFFGIKAVAGAHIISSRTLARSGGKVRNTVGVTCNRLLTHIHRFDLLDLAALALTFAIFSIRLSIVNSPSPEVGERYYETGFVFDESYYVKAARKMLNGEATNNEHPPLLKMLIILGIVLFGDAPLGWRVFPVITSSISVGLVYALTLLLSKKKSVSLAAALLFAADIMAFNMGQIGMLDAPSIMFALTASVLVLKERHDLGGLFFGLASLCKLSSIFTAAGVVLFSLLSLVKRKNPRPLTREVSLIGRVFFIALVTFLIGLWIYDAGYDVFNKNPLGHINYMWTYHNGLRYEDSKEVVLPLQWISPLNPFSPSPYHVTMVRETVAGGIFREYHPIAYYGVYTPLWWSIWLVVPISLIQTVRKARRGEERGMDLFVFSWVAANLFPYVFLAYLVHRWVYPFYLYLALPGLYAGLSHYVACLKPSRIWLALLVLTQLAWFLIWFPVKPKVLIDFLLFLGLPA